VADNRWRERVTAHRVNQGVADLRQRVNDLAGQVPQSESVAELSHLEMLCNLSERRLKISDPQLVTQVMLDRLANAADSCRTAIDSQVASMGDGNPFNWSGIASDDVLDALEGWPQLPPEELPTDLYERLASVASEADQAISRFKEQTDAASSGVQARIDEIQRTGEAGLAGLQNQLNELDTRVAGQVELIGQQVPLLQSALSTHTTQFNESETQRRTEATTALEEARLRFASSLDDQQAQHELLMEKVAKDEKDLIDQAEVRSKGLVSSLEGLQKEAGDIVGVIGRTGMTGGYQQYADGESTQADIWRFVSVAVSVLAVLVLAGAIYLTSHDKNPTWPVVSGRYLLAIVIGALATYAARQSTEHRKRSVHARQLQLRLASIGPYLQAIPKETREQVLETFSYIFFAGPDQSESEGELPDGSEAGPSYVAAILSLMSQMRSGK
jgi:ribosomal protein S28E/S33